MSEARIIADNRLAEGAITVDQYADLVSRIAGQPASDARKVADLRLAKGEITSSEHEQIIARLEPKSELHLISAPPPIFIDQNAKIKKFMPYAIAVVVVIALLIILASFSGGGLNFADNGDASECIQREGENYITYKNSCERAINAKVCWRYFLKEDYTCRDRYVVAGGTIESFMQVGATTIKVAACKENFQPYYATNASREWTCSAT